MEARARRKSKIQEKDGHSDDLDRLSSLPDSIVSHILSFIDTRSAVRTSVLSKRFKYVWTSTPCLDFRRPSSGESTCSCSCSCPAYYIDTNRRFVSFESYVNDVLQRREHTSLALFRLSVHQTVNAEFLESCLDYAAQHKVQNLRIRAHVKRKPVALPGLLLCSTSLISLRLNNATSHSMELPKSVALPNLKVLMLKNFEFCSGNYSGEVFTGCPSLESLVLSKCSIRPGDKLKVLDVCCLKLRNLEIRRWRSPWRCFHEHMINVDVPSLVSFTFQGYIARVNFREGSPCLERACIELSYPTACCMVNLSERKQKTSECLLGMLRQIRNVKFLSLSWKAIEVMSYVPDLRISELSIFENLRVIKLTSEDKYVEMTLPVECVAQLLKMEGSSDILTFDVSKVLNLWPKCAKVKPKRNDADPIGIHVNILLFLLESSPSVEFLIIEIPKVLSDEK